MCVTCAKCWHQVARTNVAYDFTSNNVSSGVAEFTAQHAEGWTDMGWDEAVWLRLVAEKCYATQEMYGKGNTWIWNNKGCIRLVDYISPLVPGVIIIVNSATS